jgi:hypothetical protein
VGFQARRDSSRARARPGPRPPACPAACRRRKTHQGEGPRRSLPGCHGRSSARSGCQRTEFGLPRAIAGGSSRAGCPYQKVHLAAHRQLLPRDLNCGSLWPSSCTDIRARPCLCSMAATENGGFLDGRDLHWAVDGQGAVAATGECLTVVRRNSSGGTPLRQQRRNDLTAAVAVNGGGQIREHTDPL